MTAANYMHVVDDDLDWLRSEIKMLDETIRQTVASQKRAKRSPDSNAVRTLTQLRDRVARIASRLDPSASITYTTL